MSTTVVRRPPRRPAPPFPHGDFPLQEPPGLPEAQGGQISTLLMPPDVPRSTCHHAFMSAFVIATELLSQLPSVFPSVALPAPVKLAYVLLCVAVFPCARFSVVPAAVVSASVKRFNASYV